MCVSVGDLGIHKPCKALGAPGPWSTCVLHLAEPGPEAAVAASCKVLPLPTVQLSPAGRRAGEQHPTLEQTPSSPPLSFRAACVDLVSGPCCLGLETMPMFWAALVALSLERPASTHWGPAATSQ